ncbi:unnamed protein product [Parascedosporium putredinis]|uniref:YCII-related domain-containing protein n=1 Tax=Parascedosporium putredinis TaxID=1442378 RepID=A0A9P1M717_9PEZI|nr:unnamed protein product [Parascedosporium putredinis]CAI7990743.1 unnamed protein product [Parascedosporium putredinis]
MPKFMLQVRSNQDTDLVDAGILLSGNALYPSSQGARVSFAGGKPATTQGPFPTDSVISGYWIIQTNDLQEALDWASKAPLKDGAAVEVRQILGADDF